MAENDPLLTSQIVVRVCLFLFAAIALFGGTLQMVLGQPEASARRDNVHRFMAGVYLSTGFINLWAAHDTPARNTNLSTGFRRIDCRDRPARLRRSCWTSSA